MFAGLRSRCTTPLSCAYSRASAICLAMVSASSSGVLREICGQPVFRLRPIQEPETAKQFSSDTNQASIIDATEVQEIPLMSKAEMADGILDRVAALLGK
jgi:hypothetical protein